MSYSLDLSEQIRLGMVDPEESSDQAVEWAGEVGRDDGEIGSVGEEGTAALGILECRGAYIEGYTEGFYERKLQDLANVDRRVIFEGGSYEGAGEMFMTRTHPHYGWTDTYTRD